MTQTPPCGPEPEDRFALAQQYVQDLHRLTQEIQLQSKFPELPTLSQLIFQREERLSTLTSLNLQTLPAEQQSVLWETLQACQELDPDVESALIQIKDRLETHLRSITSGKALIGKYKIDNPKPTGGHSKDA